MVEYQLVMFRIQTFYQTTIITDPVDVGCTCRSLDLVEKDWIAVTWTLKVPSSFGISQGLK